VFLDRTNKYEARLEAASLIQGAVPQHVVIAIVDDLPFVDDREAYVMAGIIALGRSKVATRPLIKLLRDTSVRDEIKRAAIHALVRLADKRSARELCRLAVAESTSETLKAEACDALSPFAKKPYVQKALIRSLRDPSANVRYYSLTALSGRARIPTVLEALTSLQSDTSLTWGGESVGEWAKRIVRNA
jgi:hypothetical protein